MANETARVSLAERRKHVRAWKKSGLTAREYATREGLNHWTLHGWASRLNQQQANQTAEPAVRFVPASLGEIEVTPQVARCESPIDGCVELEIRGVKVRVSSAFHENTLRRVLDVLETRP